MTNGKDTRKKTPRRGSAARTSQPALDPRLLRRVVVENIYPQVDGGRFPVKRTVDERLSVSADVYADGHDLVAAALLYRRKGETAWTELLMTATANDRWTAAFAVPEPGRYEYTVEGWIDRFGTWRHEISKKFGAGQDISSELLEGAEIVRAALGSGIVDADTQTQPAAQRRGTVVTVGGDARRHRAVAGTARRDRTRSRSSACDDDACRSQPRDALTSASWK